MNKIPRGYLKLTEPVSADTAARIRDRWEQSWKNGVIPVLSYDVDFIPLPQPTKKVKRRNRNL